MKDYYSTIVTALEIFGARRVVRVFSKSLSHYLLTAPARGILAFERLHSGLRTVSKKSENTRKKGNNIFQLQFKKGIWKRVKKWQVLLNIAEKVNMQTDFVKLLKIERANRFCNTAK